MCECDLFFFTPGIVMQLLSLEMLLSKTTLEWTCCAVEFVTPLFYTRCGLVRVDHFCSKFGVSHAAFNG